MGTNFYTDADATCNNPEHTETLHIGKSSGGWKFGFHAIDRLGLVSWAAWREFLRDRPIRDEYGVTLTLDEFTARVTDRGDAPWCRVAPSSECRANGYGGRWRPDPDHEFHDPEGFDFSRHDFS